MQFFLEWLSRKIEHMSFSFEWVNGCDFFHALDGMGRQQKQKKSDRHYSSTCVASPHLSEYVYIDSCIKAKTTKYMHLLCIDIPRKQFQNRVQACFDCRMFLWGKSLKASEGCINSFP